MQIEIRWGIIDQVTVVLRIMASIVSPLTLAQGAVNVLGRTRAFGFSHDGDIGTDKLLSERRCLPHKTRNDTLVALCQHGWDDIPLRAEIKQREKIIQLLCFRVLLRCVDV